MFDFVTAQRTKNAGTEIDANTLNLKATEVSIIPPLASLGRMNQCIFPTLHKCFEVGSR